MHTNSNAESPGMEAAIQATLAANPGITREALVKYLEREAQTTEAARAPFPGALRDAFAALPQALFGHTLQPVTLELLSVLEEIHSPFIDMVEIICSMQGRPQKEISRAIEKKLKPKIKDLAAAAWCFLTPIDQVQTALATGEVAFKKTALGDISRNIPPDKLSGLNSAIILHYIKTFSTAVDYRAKKPEGGGSFPLAPAEPKPASAGASTSAAS
jgi:hypothetical protein